MKPLPERRPWRRSPRGAHAPCPGWIAIGQGALTLGALTLAGCSPLPGADGLRDPVPGVTAPVRDPDTGPDWIVEDVGSYTLPDDDWVFDPTVIHTMSLRVEPEAVAALEADPTAMVEARFTLDGEEIEPVGLRLGGAGPTFRSLAGKPELRLQFDAYDPDARLTGMSALVLDNALEDCSGLKRSIGSALFRQGGVPAQRTGYGSLTLNGEDFGLYVVVEAADSAFARRGWANGTGNLYDGQNLVAEDGSQSAVDFQTGLDGGFRLLAGEDVALADVLAVTAAIESTLGTPEYDGTTSAVVHWEAVHRMWAVEEWIGQVDGYFLDHDQYFVYFDPTTGGAELAPAGLDNSFNLDGAWGVQWTGPVGRLGLGCLQDGNCAYDQRDATEAFLDSLDLAALTATLEAQAALTADLAVADPRTECTDEAISTSRALLSQWLLTRNVLVETRWGL
jgi:hypothetical protein